jgi:hypothetical protein
MDVNVIIVLGYQEAVSVVNVGSPIGFLRLALRGIVHYEP